MILIGAAALIGGPIAAIEAMEPEYESTLSYKARALYEARVDSVLAAGLPNTRESSLYRERLRTCGALVIARYMRNYDWGTSTGQQAGGCVYLPPATERAVMRLAHKSVQDAWAHQE